MKGYIAGPLALGLCLALTSGSLRAEEQTNEQTHEMSVEFYNKSDINVSISSEGTKVTDGDVNNGAFDEVKVSAKGGEYTALWQIKLCPPEKTDDSDPETSEKYNLYTLRISYTNEQNGVDDATLCTVTYRYDQDKQTSHGKKCVLRKKSQTTPDDNVSDDDNIYTDGGGRLRDHECIDERSGIGPHIRILTLESAH